MAMVGQGQRQKKNRPDMATRKMTAKEQDRHDILTGTRRDRDNKRRRTGLAWKGQRQQKNNTDMTYLKGQCQESTDMAGQGQQKENRSGMEGTTTAKEQDRHDILIGTVSGKYRHGETGTTKGEEQA